MAAAATKISSVYKGNKDREMVRDLKAARESNNDDGQEKGPDEGGEGGEAAN